MTNKETLKQSLILNNIDEIRQQKLIKLIELAEELGYKWDNYDEIGGDLLVTFIVK